MKKRISALFLALAMLLCCSAAALPSFAEQKPIIILSQESTISGVEKRIEVYLENNPGIWGLDLKINYNRDVMTLKNVENGDFFSDSEWTPGNLNADTYILSYEANGLERQIYDSQNAVEYTVHTFYLGKRTSGFCDNNGNHGCISILSFGGIVPQEICVYRNIRTCKYANRGRKENGKAHRFVHCSVGNTKEIL